MARIRTIKPEFFTSEDICLLSPLSRLLYIALWCESDREGRFEWKPNTLKLRYFPGDECDILSMCNELIQADLIIVYEIDGKKYAEIPTFKEHQVINNRETESIIPPIDNDAYFTRESGVQAEGRKEGREGKEGITDTNVSVADKNNLVDPCPHQSIIDLYHQILPMGLQVRVWNGTRASHLKARWREDAKRQSLEYWERLFNYVAESPFLTGKVHDAKRHPFEITLEWIVSPNNFAKIIEGFYHRGAHAA